MRRHSTSSGVHLAPGVHPETLQLVQGSSFLQRSALLGQPEWIMLDNMPPAAMREAVAIVAGRCKLEASGGIDATTIRAVAETGVDAISLGCLTHSVKAADLSLEIAI